MVDKLLSKLTSDPHGAHYFDLAKEMDLNELLSYKPSKRAGAKRSLDGGDHGPPSKAPRAHKDEGSGVAGSTVPAGLDLSHEEKLRLLQSMDEEEEDLGVWEGGLLGSFRSSRTNPSLDSTIAAHAWQKREPGTLCTNLHKVPSSPRIVTTECGVRRQCVPARLALSPSVQREIERLVTSHQRESSHPYSLLLQGKSWMLV